ncbi:dienelactone hydrolase family protein [Rhodococcus sp. G-MC3]|uniref:dienelactone hydrolase family protein n=1 Tax=Rhodococcus sp. G-MC3 TaxID=3046209 RepID=UPI0024B9127F|nr:dienelactone hydrolase family protein [Rhodococcus sp. G-MC3]MDJ0392717.1 dienelactone hydrolase family protein [Rhodococcus sp. G-MC3]
MATPKKLAALLGQRGPHKVLRGNLALAGQPGVVFSPAEGYNLPAVAFGHGWLLGADRYANTLKHLASWGIVAAAPDTERGPIPSHRGLASDLGTVLDIVTGVRLGTGNISVHPDKLAVVGHGMGASVAVLTAAARSDVKAVAALYPAPSSPSAEEAAHTLTIPGLVLGDAAITDSLNDNTVSLAGAMGGPSIFRRIDKASSDGIVEGRRLMSPLVVGGTERSTVRTTRILLTAFLLFHLTGDKTYEELAGDAELKGTRLIDPHAPIADQPKPSPLSAVRAVIGR